MLKRLQNLKLTNRSTFNLDTNANGACGNTAIHVLEKVQ
jgi:hypothetical protein